jgi:exopolysaccharide production protein ExoQ
MSERELSFQTSSRGTSFERLFVVIVLLFAAGAFSSLWTVPGQTQKVSGMFLMQVLWMLVYLCTIFLFFRRCEQPSRTFFSGWPLVAMCAFAMVSTLWSAAPGLTLRRSVALTLTLLFGVYFASRFSVKEQLRLLAWTFGICVVFSFIFGALGLGNSVDGGGGILGWYGIFDQKNGLGESMVLSALVFHFWRRVEPESRHLAYAGFIGSVGLIALSRSMTSVVVFGLLMVLLPYLRWTARKPVRWMIAGIVFLVGVGTVTLIYVATHMEQVTGLLGKSATLTGRIQIWILSTVVALRRPWLGYGFNAFWLPTERFTQQIWHVMHWQVPHAHNGFIELWLELGAVGVGLFLLAFLYYTVKALLHLRRGGEAAGWPLVFLVYLFLNNLTETNLLSRNTIFFILLAATAMATQRVRRLEPAKVDVSVVSESPA